MCMYAMQSRNPMYMRTKGRAWEAVFVGEGSQDAGVRRHAEVVLWVLGDGFVTLLACLFVFVQGPYRESIDQMCAEICSPALPLFIKTPNHLANQGANRCALLCRVCAVRRCVCACEM